LISFHSLQHWLRVKLAVTGLSIFMIGVLQYIYS
jgi:hypothetical protein